MKQNKQQWIRSALMAFGLLGLASGGLAQNTNPTNTFDNAASTTSFVTWWGPPSPTMTWDSTRDAANDSGSGSVRYEEAFVGAAGEQFMTFFTIANRWGWDLGYILDATTYTNLGFDIKVDPSSGQRVGNNDFGWLEIGLCTGTGPGTTYLPGRAIPLSATNWTHFDYPLEPSLNNIDKVSGFFIKMWSNGNHTNTLAFNIDNFVITKPTAPVIIPPPTVALTKNISGLNAIASGSGQYDRQSIRTVDSTFGWVGSTEPVTYEFTIKDSPGATRPGYQAHLFLVPNLGTDTAPSIDWNTPNLLWLHLQNQTNGGGQLTLRYKTNLPSGNDMLFNSDPSAMRTNVVGGVTNISTITVGNLGSLSSSNILGTWKMTLSNDTNITIFASDGTSTNLSIPPEAAPLFSGSVQAFFGAQPNNLSYGGTGYVFSKAKISTPSTTMIEDNFTGATLDTNKWVVQASDAPGVFVVPPTSPYSVEWTLPATSFYPEISTNITPGSTWKSPLSSVERKIQTVKRVLLDQSELDAKASFARVVKRPYTKLQVLLPGETSAPGTTTGKTGTPTDQTAGVPFNLTVNSVDTLWRVVSSTNVVNITSTDTAATLPADTALVGGTANLIVTFGGSGTNFTITATDVSDGTKTPGISSSVNVP